MVYRSTDIDDLKDDAIEMKENIVCRIKVKEKE
jgi:hypothetical protein